MHPYRSLTTRNINPTISTKKYRRWRWLIQFLCKHRVFTKVMIGNHLASLHCRTCRKLTKCICSLCEAIITDRVIVNAKQIRMIK